MAKGHVSGQETIVTRDQSVNYPVVTRIPGARLRFLDEDMQVWRVTYSSLESRHSNLAFKRIFTRRSDGRLQSTVFEMRSCSQETAIFRRASGIDVPVEWMAEIVPIPFLDINGAYGDTPRCVSQSHLGVFRLAKDDDFLGVVTVYCQGRSVMLTRDREMSEVFSKFAKSVRCRTGNP